MSQRLQITGGMIVFSDRTFIRNSGMSRTRFQNILTALHLCDFEEDAGNQRKKTRGAEYDPLLKVKPVMEEIQLACKTYYVPGQNVSIDERMVASKGRSCMKQYIKINLPNGASNFGSLLVLDLLIHTSLKFILARK